jgi:hypothetical protein
MKKLRLDQEDLRVETFGPDGEAGTRGTVMGRDTFVTYNYEWECQSYQATCLNTGCQTGLTATCGTGGATDCPGQGECAPYTNGHTCANTCTDVQACTFCGAVC